MSKDVDGDELNVVVSPIIIQAAKREIQQRAIVPLLYDLGFAPASQVSREEMFNGLSRAHKYSGIGQVSNSLTRLWAKPEPDLYAAACITYLNNLTIDAAKSGFLNGFENYPELSRRINRAIGGKHGRMPWFFQYTKNGRRGLHLPVASRKQYRREGGCAMDRISRRFNDIGNMNMNAAKVPPFNWQMLLRDNDAPYLEEAVEIFCSLDDSNKCNIAFAATDAHKMDEVSNALSYEFIKEQIVEALSLRFDNLEHCYPSLVKYLFAGDNAGKISKKQMFWRVFGEMAYEILSENMKTFTVCPHCGMKIPSWVKKHACPKAMTGFFECVDCGAWCERINSKQCRCEPCQKAHRRITNLNLVRARRIRKAA